MSTHSRLVVIKKSPTPRNIVGKEFIYGILSTEIKVLSKYIFVDSGRLTRHLPEVPTKVYNTERIISSISSKIEAETRAFVSYNYPSRTRELVVPGSSVKGNIRARIELSMYPRDGNIKSCFSVWRSGRASWRHVKIFPGSKLSREGCDYLNEYKVCPVCDVFGSSGLASRVFFSDFICKQCDTENISVRKGFRVEAVKKDSIFIGNMWIAGLRRIEVGLLLWGMGIDHIGREGMPALFGRLKYARPDFGVISYRVLDFTPATYSGVDREEFLSNADNWIKEAEDEYWLKRVDELSAKENLG